MFRMDSASKVHGGSISIRKVSGPCALSSCQSYQKMLQTAVLAGLSTPIFEIVPVWNRHAELNVTQHLGTGLD